MPYLTTKCTESPLKILLNTLILRKKHGLIISWKIILNFIWVVPLSVTVQYRWKTIKTGCWDLVKGDCNHLIEVKITVSKEKHICDFDNWSLNTGWLLNMVPFNTGLIASINCKCHKKNSTSFRNKVLQEQGYSQLQVSITSLILTFHHCSTLVLQDAVLGKSLLYFLQLHLWI